mmetsp:Transcript_18488/g.26615  ORF Transcript_18488/g.26615 Transcript_18488/m.26615 type:complete len:121 (-) Transcript_18488:1375-1737(-)
MAIPALFNCRRRVVIQAVQISKSQPSQKKAEEFGELQMSHVAISVRWGVDGIKGWWCCGTVTTFCGGRRLGITPDIMDLKVGRPRFGLSGSSFHGEGGGGRGAMRCRCTELRSVATISGS